MVDVSGVNTLSPVHPRPWYFGKHRLNKDSWKTMRASVKGRPRRDKPKLTLRSISEDDLTAEQHNDVADIVVRSLDVLLVDDFNQLPLPLLALSASLNMFKEAKVSAHSADHTQVWTLLLGLCVSSFNANVSAWEPVLEPIAHNVVGGLQPWTTELKLVQEPATRRKKAATRVFAVSKEPLEITVTSSLLDYVLTSGFVQERKTERVSKLSMLVAKELIPAQSDSATLFVCNKACSAIEVKLADAFTAAAQKVILLSSSIKSQSDIFSHCTDISPAGPVCTASVH